MITKEASQKIKNMGLVCACLVVGIHVDFPMIDDKLSAGWFMSNLFVEGIARIAVPFFFVVSGYFFAGHLDENGWWKREVRKRLRSLVVPYYIWVAISIAVLTPIGICADIIGSRPVGKSLYWYNNPLDTIGLGYKCFPIVLWYIRCLFCFILFGHVFKWCVSKLKIVWLVLAYALYLSSNQMLKDGVLYNILVSGGISMAIFYFSLGLYIRRFAMSNCAKMSNFFVVMVGAIGCFLLILKTYFVYKGCYEMEPCLRILALPFLLLFVWAIIPNKKWPDWLTSCSFPIYLIHIMTIQYINVVLKQLGIDAMFRAIVVYAGGIFGSILITLALRKWAPRFSKLIFGGR